MPCRGSDEGSAYLHNAQAYRFTNPLPMAKTVTDGCGRVWGLHSGNNDPEEENYGLFQDGKLIARISLISPALDPECWTGFWVIGRIEVETPFQKQGIGYALAAAVCQVHGKPLASDLNQSAGGAAVWKKLIREHPGKIELHEANGNYQTVTVQGGCLSPDPWAHHDRRLVRRF